MRKTGIERESKGRTVYIAIKLMVGGRKRECNAEKIIFRM